MKTSGSMRRIYRVGAALAALSVLSAAGQAADFLVTNLNDTGTGSLRRAVNNAEGTPGADTITINVTGTVLLVRSIDFTDTDQVTIYGPGANLFALDGQQLDRVISVGSSTVIINGITIQNGRCDVGSQGGGANVFGGTLELNDCALVGNSVPLVVGSERNGGAVRAEQVTTFIARRCLFADNLVEFGHGGAVRSTGYMTLENCTFHNNVSTEGGAISYYSELGQTALIDSCTVTGNSASEKGGGIRVGMGVCNIRNSIFAGNSAPKDPDVNDTIVSLGHNIVGNVGDSITWVASDKLNTDPLLGSLSDNGGTTKTIPLLPGSPALNAADPLNFPSVDQRGVVRPINGFADIGAFESSISPNQPPNANAGVDQTLNPAVVPVLVTLDGSGSNDPEKDPLTYAWFDSANNAVGATSVVQINLGPGVHTFKLVVEDPSGLKDEDTVTITVVDPAAPTISGVSVSPYRLWTPNHTMRTVKVYYSATDPTDPKLDVWLTVVSSEADSGLGADDIPNDIDIIDVKTVKLRAERYSRSGRTYTITIHARDDEGHETTKTVTVFVPWHGSKG